MRLIDADALIKEYPSASGLKCVIENAPTAYDVDAVVEELKNAGNQEVIFHGGRCNGKAIAVGFCKGIERAIDIVRKGGKE